MIINNNFQLSTMNLAHNESSQDDSSSTSVDGSKQLNSNFQPGPFDCICARGNAVKNHPGNIHFVKVVEEYLPKYAIASSKVEKSFIVSDIIKNIRNAAISNGGGFVKKLPDGHYYALDDHTAREKVGQCLRDLLHEKYSSSKRTKKRRRVTTEVNLVNLVDDIVAESNGKDLADRIQELTAISDPEKSDEEMQAIFNQANFELLTKIALMDQSDSSKNYVLKRKADFNSDESESSFEDF